METRKYIDQILACSFSQGRRIQLMELFIASLTGRSLRNLFYRSCVTFFSPLLIIILLAVNSLHTCSINTSVKKLLIITNLTLCQIRLHSKMNHLWAIGIHLLNSSRIIHEQIAVSFYMMLGCQTSFYSSWNSRRTKIKYSLGEPNHGTSCSPY